MRDLVSRINLFPGAGAGAAAPGDGHDLGGRRGRAGRAARRNGARGAVRGGGGMTDKKKGYQMFSLSHGYPVRYLFR